MNFNELLDTIDPESFFEWMNLTIKHTGASYRGACPIHQGNNKTAFSFSPKMRLFYCHTHCGFIGDFVGMYMKVHRCSLDDARRAIAQWQGWDQVDFSFQPKAPRVKVIQPLPMQPTLLPEVSEWEKKTLLPVTEHERFPSHVLQRFGIRKGTYGRYKNRIVFPITDHHGRWVGCNGRWIGNDFEEQDVPKYLYSAAPFQTGSVLYGYEFADQSDSWILHEGVTDVIKAYEHGFHAVAVLGIHVTLEQISLLKMHNKPIILAFDGDQAGKNGMKKAIQSLWQYHFMNIKVALFPPGEDPGSVSKEVYEQCIREAITAHQFLQTYHH